MEFCILFIGYFFLIQLLFKKNGFIKNSNIPYLTILFIFSIKVLTAFFYGLYFSKSGQVETADTWRYFSESTVETDWLFNNPKAFAADLFTNYHHTTGNLFIGTHSYWNDLKATFFIKVLAIINVFTNKNYYVNILFFNAFFVFGGVALYRLFNQYFQVKKWILVVAVFLAPGFLFWCSGIHKDGLLFTASAILLYTFNSIIHNSSSFKRWAILLVCFLLIFILGNYYVLAIFPAIAGYFICTKYKRNPFIVYSCIVAICLFIFLFSNNFSFTKGISESVVTKHNEFLLLTGNTKFNTPVLENTTADLLKFLPFAFSSSLLRPVPGSDIKLTQLIPIVENYLILFLLLGGVAYSIVFHKPSIRHPLILTCLTISFFLLLFIGYTVCFDGAIVRYRSVLIPFLLVPAVVLLLGKLKQQEDIFTVKKFHI